MSEKAKLNIKDLVNKYNEELTNTLTHMRVFSGYMKAAVLLLVDHACANIPYPCAFIEDEKYEDAFCDFLSVVEQNSKETEINKAADRVITIHKIIAWDFSKEIFGKIDKNKFDEYDIPRVLGLFVLRNVVTNSIDWLIRQGNKDIAELTKYHDVPTGRAINPALFSKAEEIAEESMKGREPLVEVLNDL